MPAVLAVAMLGVPAGAGAAAPGDLDATFSGDGALTIDFGFGGGDYVEDVARQPDGKLVVAGGSDDNLAIARLLHDGSLDASFADAGRLTAGVGGGAVAVAVQSDGKIVALLGGGSVRRYTPAGLPDESFAGDGEQAVPAVERGSDLAVQQDGRIVVSGWSDVGEGDTGFAVARLESGGSLDESFSGDGVHVHDFAGASAYSNHVAIQGDGKIVVAGAVSTGDGEETFGNDFALARYNADGSLDTSFSADGLQTTNFQAGYQHADSLAIHSDGTIVAAGELSSWTGTHGIAVARYAANGSLDPAFSGDGKEILDLGFDYAPPEASDVAVQGDGKVVIAGNVSKDSFFDGSDFLVIRLTQAGSLDSAFAGDGMQTTNFGGNDRATDVLVEPDGAIVAAGVAHPSDFGVVRYGAGGVADPSLSGDGSATVDFPGVEHASDVLVQPDGKVVTIGSNGSDWGTGAIALTRHGPDGSLDAGFAQDGIQVTPFDDYGAGVAGALQSDGKILAAGGRDIGNEDAWIVARYNPDGSLDQTFSGDGKQTVGFDGYASFPTASDIAVLPDGRILIVGTAADPDEEPTGVGIARLHPNGSLDTSFSGDGRRTIGVGDSYHRPRLALAPGGKFVVATVGYEEGESVFVEGLQVSRFNSNGSFDETFSADGRHTVDFNHFESVIGVAVQPDGRIVAAVGTFRLDGPNPIGLVRLGVNGSLDPSFGDGGRQTLDFGYNYESGGDLLLRPDGRIVLSVSQGLVQVTPEGELDATFSGDGLVSRSVGVIDRLGRAAIDANGSIVVAGSLDQDLALVRYVGHALPAADTTAPVTTITSGPEGATTVSTPTFEFSSNEPGSTFECRVDGGPFATCDSPHTTAPLAAGGHTFEVRATDVAGNVDLSPAARSFTVQSSGSPGPTGPSGDSSNPVPQPQPPAAGGISAPVVQPGPASTPAQPAACRRARSARQRAVKRVKAVSKKVRAAGRPAAKRKWRRVATKRKVALRKATRRAKRACG